MRNWAKRKIGFQARYNKPEEFQMKTVKYGLVESIPAGIKRGVETTGDYLKQFKLFFKKDLVDFKKNLHLVIHLAHTLDIPALDGGHVLFLMGEMITGRKPSEKFLEYAQIAGMILLLALVLYANANDIIKIVNGTF